jgi:cellulose biosynthesis protein BcsQ
MDDDAGRVDPGEERHVVVGLAAPRRTWFRDLARWSNGAVAPFDFVKCLTADEARAVLAAGRPASLLLVDAGLTHWDRDLIEAARDAGAATVLVDDGRSTRDWEDLGCAASLSEPFGPPQLLDVLRRHGRPSTGAALPRRVSLEPEPERGRLLAVSGVPGCGRSTVAMLLAQGLAGADGGEVVLVDGCRRASLAMYHRVGDVIPGLPEVVDLHRRDRPDPEEIRDLTFDVPDRGYALVLGQRRSRDWVTMRPRAVAAALDGLGRAFDDVVVDHDADLEGEDDTGSVDVEERHALARRLADTADVIALVTSPGLHGMHRLVELVDDFCRHGTPLHRLLPVVARAPRSPVDRAELTRAVHELTAERRGVGPAINPPVFVGSLRRIEDVHRDARPLPAGPARALARAVAAVLTSSGGTRPVDAPGTRPDGPVRPGELGAAFDVGRPAERRRAADGHGEVA